MINTVYFMSILLIFLRMLTFFIIVPIFFPKGTPNIVKVLFSVIIAFILMPGVDTASVANINNNLDLYLYFANEVISGLVLGFITNLCFQIIRMAGSLIDMQMGFSMLSMFDPNASSNVTLLERLLYWVSLILFFIINGHHMLIRSILESFNAVPLGKSLLFQDTIMLIVNTFTNYFAIGLKIAIPLVLIIVLTDITLGLVGRTVPHLNIMILGLPIKILVGLTCFAFALPLLAKELIHIFNSIPDIYHSIFKTVPLMLIFASEEKTEQATPKKKSDAKKKGQVAKSKEISLALTLLTSTIIIIALGGFVGNSLKDTLFYFLSKDLSLEMGYNNLTSLTLTVLWRIGLAILPILLPIMITGIIANYIQTGFIFTSDTIMPKLSKLNPLNGFKKMFSSRTVVELFKDLAIVSIVGYVCYLYIKDNYTKVLNMGNLRIERIPAEFSNLLVGIFFRVTLIMITLALIDFIYQLFMFNKDLKMTKQEIKEEYKQSEGDPQLKSKIRQKQRELGMGRMMQQIPDATVIVTNPTHIAIALRYKEGVDQSPTVVAKGSDYLALKIKEIAKEHDIPIIENKPLARLIFEEVDINSTIPVDMYQAVAEILALVYKMKKKKKH